MPPSPPRILIVDDSEDDSLLAAASLRRALPGLSVRRVDSPDAMREALDTERYDLVISDHAMPRFDSLGALEILRASGRAIPFVVFSGRDDEALALRVLRAGVTEFVHKGDADRLAPVVRRELEVAAPAGGGARPDPVTGLERHPALLALLDGALDSGKPPPAVPALLRVDIDRFRRINRAYGSATGDRILRDVAARLAAELAACDRLARGEADEFLVLVDRAADAAAALRRAERVLRCLDEPILREGNTFYVTASAGLAAFPAHGNTAAELYRSAGDGIERARAIGINRVAFGTPAHDPAPPAAGQGGAIPVAELYVLALPVVALANGRTWGVEAAARRRSAGVASHAPDLETALLPARAAAPTVSHWLAGQAAALVARLRQGGLADGRVAVNLSRAMFLDAGTPDALAADLARAGLSPDCVEIEVPERWVLADPERTVEAARRCRAAGLRLALDEFGANYGPLAPLQRLAPDTIKLAPALARDLEGGGSAAVTGALALARAMGAALVATGVETPSACGRLAALGVDRAQGSAFAAAPVAPSAPLVPARYEAAPAAAARDSAASG